MIWKTDELYMYVECRGFCRTLRASIINSVYNHYCHNALKLSSNKPNPQAKIFQWSLHGFVRRIV